MKAAFIKSQIVVEGKILRLLCYHRENLEGWQFSYLNQTKLSLRLPLYVGTSFPWWAGGATVVYGRVGNLRSRAAN